ncbi:MAG: flagellar biosynthesis anti-sigma factor FlgM [Pseudomonadota bacterium]
MVDPINSGNASRLRAADAPVRAGQAEERIAPVASSAGAKDAASLSDAATKASAALAEAPPPFDASRVDRIKTAIADGSYPVDAERIAEAFFRDFEALET